MRACYSILDGMRKTGGSRVGMLASHFSRYFARRVLCLYYFLRPFFSPLFYP